MVCLPDGYNHQHIWYTIIYSKKTHWITIIYPIKTPFSSSQTLNVITRPGTQKPLEVPFAAELKAALPAAYSDAQVLPAPSVLVRLVQTEPFRGADAEEEQRFYTRGNDMKWISGYVVWNLRILFFPYIGTYNELYIYIGTYIIYPLVMTNSLLLKMAIEIDDLDIEHAGSFHSYVNLPEGRPIFSRERENKHSNDSWREKRWTIGDPCD